VHTPSVVAPKITAADAIIQQLADENRRVLSDWRAAVLLRRATKELAPDRRKWKAAPGSVREAKHFLSQMVSHGQIRHLDVDVSSLYEVTVPYAPTRTLTEDELLMEVHPYSALSHLSALAFHNLIDRTPREISASVPSEPDPGWLPVGTTSDDWEGSVLLVGQHQPRTILGTTVLWRRVRRVHWLGVAEYKPIGYPVRVTTPERTLLDGLLAPASSGGIETVLRAWKNATDTIDVNALVDLAEKLSVSLLLQRAGYVLEELGIHHPRIDEWQAHASRGGSSKLVASAPYSPTYSERWNLSINSPVDSLDPLRSGGD
jgi:predicted transcriptional regulator of viral defense system